VGKATGLGPVVDRVIDPVSAAMGQAGGQLAGSDTPLTREVGEVLGNTSRTLGHTGDLVSGPTNGGAVSPVEQVGRATNTAIVPITAGVTQVATRVNDATGVGTPVGNLLVTTGGAVQQLGVGVQGNGSQPVVNSLGEVVNQTGGLVANIGGAVGGTTGGGGGAGGVLAPVVGAVNGLTGGTVGGGSTGGAVNVLAPVVNTVGALTGGITATVGGSAAAGGGTSTPLTTTLTNTLGGITGGLTGALRR
jgi:hypothetical protein